MEGEVIKESHLLLHSIGIYKFIHSGAMYNVSKPSAQTFVRIIFLLLADEFLLTCATIQLVLHLKHSSKGAISSSKIYKVSKNNCTRLCGYCGGAANSIISVFTQLHWSGFNLEFENLFESI